MKRIVKPALVIFFAAAIIATVALGFAEYRRKTEANVSHDTLEWAGAAFDAVMLAPVIAGELFACRALIYLFAGKNRSRARTARNAVVLGLSALMILLPVLLLNEVPLRLGLASDRTNSLLLALQMGLPFALGLPALLLTAADAVKALR